MQAHFRFISEETDHLYILPKFYKYIYPYNDITVRQLSVSTPAWMRNCGVLIVHTSFYSTHSDYSHCPVFFVFVFVFLFFVLFVCVFFVFFVLFVCLFLFIMSIVLKKLERFSAFAVFGLRGWWRVVVGFKAIVIYIRFMNCCHVCTLV